MKENFYYILGIKKRVSIAEIKKAYAKLARKYHPDINPGDKSLKEKYEAMAEAYSVLSNPKKKRKYDELGHDEYTSRSGAELEDAADFDQIEIPFSTNSVENNIDILDQILDGRNQEEVQPLKGENLEKVIELNFWEAVNGTTETINVEYKLLCPKCMKIKDAELLNASCDRCGGRRYETVTEKIEVEIPPGAEQNSRIKVAGKGYKGRNGGEDGDLYVTLYVSTHQFFWRRGKDLFMELPISFYEAILGAKINVPTVDGWALLSIPPGIQNGQKLRLKGKGIKSEKNGAKGDQYAVVKIMAPETLSPVVQEQLEELQNKYPYNPREMLDWGNDETYNRL